MKILVTTHHLLNLSGTEIFTQTLVNYLTRNKHDVILYSKYINKDIPFLFEKSVKIVDNLELIKNEKFDIAHVHHNINAFEIRRYFPEIKIIFMSHGILPFLEQPPIPEIGVSKYLAVSEEVKNNLIENYNINQKKIVIIRNLIDKNIFKETKNINKYPKKALVISSRIDTKSIKIIKKTCKKLHIKCDFVGKQNKVVSQIQLVKLINESDIVFSLGRGAMEAMFCGRIPIIFDYLGGDGMVTPKNFSKIMAHNFSGREKNKKFSKKELIKEIEKYKPEYGKVLQEKALKEFEANNQIKKIINVYKESNKQKINLKIYQKNANSINSIIWTTRHYSNISTLEYKTKLEKISNELSIIKSSKFFKLWPLYCKLKKILKPNEQK